MKPVLALLIALLSLNLYAASIYKCRDLNGNITFSGQPCASEQNTQVLIRSSSPAPAPTPASAPSSDSTLTATRQSIPGIEIRNQAEFIRFSKSLSFSRISEIIDGVSKAGFHGMNIDQLATNNSIDFDTTSDGLGKTNFLVFMTPDAKLFMAWYGVEVDGRKEHPFLDLSNEILIGRMKAKGFGEPRVIGLEEDFEWKWKTDKMKCNILYSRSFQNPTKSIAYSCEKK